jgi:hypothetical protein
MPDASALWNLNRQLSFFAGALLLAQALNLALAWLTRSPRGTGCLFLLQASPYCLYCMFFVLTIRRC